MTDTGPYVDLVQRVLEDANLWIRMRMDDMELTGDPAHEVAEDIVAALVKAGALDV